VNQTTGVVHHIPELTFIVNQTTGVVHHSPEISGVNFFGRV